MKFLTQIPVHFINNVTPIWADIIIFCATYLGIAMLACIFVYLIFRRIPYSHAFSTLEHIIKKMGDIFVLSITASGSYVLSVILKNLFEVTRPQGYHLDLHPLLTLSGYGFPSSHAAFYSAVAVTLFFINKSAGYIALFLVFILGMARILAGVHSLADIIGGFILGIIISCSVDFVVEKLNDWKTA